MESAYFTPEIEDFYVGYEFQCKVYGEEDEWVNCIYSRPTDEVFCKDSDDNIWTNDSLRVPYLTKEQIEAEGWELIQIYPKGACIFQKGTKEEGCELTCDFTEHRVHFTKLYFYGLDDEYTRTKLTWSSLECKDINTFRKICKLLRI
jgi:hypothetical protein